MSYEMSFGDGALDEIVNDVPKRYANCIQAALNRLRSDPTNLGRRCSFPYPGTKTFDFECTSQQDHGFVFRVHYHFEEGERSIRVFDMKAVANW